MADTQTQTPAPTPTQPYPHGARSPEPFWAAHIRKLESDLAVMIEENGRLRTAVDIAKQFGAELLRYDCASGFMAHSKNECCTNTARPIPCHHSVARKMMAALAATGTGAEVEG